MHWACNGDNSPYAILSSYNTNKPQAYAVLRVPEKNCNKKGEREHPGIEHTI